MTFRETLARHLQAIHDRDLAALAASLPADELILVTAEGTVLRSAAEVLDAHRGWFAQPTWRLGVDEVAVYETAEMGVAVLRLDYRESPPGRDPFRRASILTLIFAHRGGRWLMVQDQNTPIKQAGVTTA